MLHRASGSLGPAGIGTLHDQDFGSGRRALHEDLAPYERDLIARCVVEAGECRVRSLGPRRGDLLAFHEDSGFAANPHVVDDHALVAGVRLGIERDRLVHHYDRAGEHRVVVRGIDLGLPIDQAGVVVRIGVELLPDRGGPIRDGDLLG